MRTSSIVAIVCTLCMVRSSLISSGTASGSAQGALISRDEDPNMNHGDHGGESSSDDNSGEHDSMEPSPMSMHAHHGRPALEQPDLEPQQRKYWEQYNVTTFFNADKGSKTLLFLHSGLTVLAWGVLYPTTVMMSTDVRAQWFYVPLQSLQAVISALAVLFLLMYLPTAPDLYPGAIYPGVTIAMLLLVAVHWLAMIVKSIISYIHQTNSEDTQYVLADLQSPEHQHSNYGGDSRHSGSHDDAELSYSDTIHSPASFDIEDEARIGSPSYRGAQLRPSALVSRLANNSFFMKLTHATESISQIIFSILNFPLLVLGVLYLLLGIATGFCLGKGHNVFALLAHFIKGSVFFMLGFFELARYFGAFAEYGMAWNARLVESVYPVKRKGPSTRTRFWWLSYLRFWPDHPTMEFWQCFLIFFYGSTNIFLEHLGNNDGGKWSHKDLQHVSIAFMFFGGGLSGLVLESTTIKRAMCSAFGTDYQPPTVRTYSLNPMPAFTIFWTGALMSRHQQETELSTAIHVQWGSMFSIAAVLRLITLALLYVRSTPSDGTPQRPFTEVLAASCLVCGGLIFMSSNRETVEAEIYRGFDQMFTLNVSVGVTMLLLAMFSLALALKGWATGRGNV